MLIGTKQPYIELIAKQILEDGVYIPGWMGHQSLSGKYQIYRIGYRRNVGWAMLHAWYKDPGYASLSTFVMEDYRRLGHATGILNGFLMNSDLICTGRTSDAEQTYSKGFFFCGYGTKEGQKFYEQYFSKANAD